MDRRRMESGMMKPTPNAPVFLWLEAPHPGWAWVGDVSTPLRDSNSDVLRDVAQMGCWVYMQYVSHETGKVVTEVWK
jgi:hypothetical protein